MSAIEQVQRERRTEALVRSMDAAEIAEALIALEDRVAHIDDLCDALEACAEYGAMTWEHDRENEPNCYRDAREVLAMVRGDS